MEKLSLGNHEGGIDLDVLLMKSKELGLVVYETEKGSTDEQPPEKVWTNIVH
jgi:hypothetical protein